MKRPTAVVMAAVACAAVGVGVWYFLRGPTEPAYRTATAEQGDISVSISATGSPNAVVTVQVGSQVSGTIQSLYADFNSKVTKGQLIARIDPAALQAKVDAGQASLDSAKASVANADAGVLKAQAALQAGKAGVLAAQANVVKTQVATADAQVKADRRLQLVKAGILAKEDAETAVATSRTATADQNSLVAQKNAADDNVRVAQAELVLANTQLDSNKASVKQFEAALRSSQIDLDHTFIKAPVDGVVVARSVDVGQTVAASLATPTLFQIAQDLTKMQVDTNVSEADVGRIVVGQPGSFSVDAYPGKVFRGEVTQIRKAPINQQNVITYDVVIGVSNPDLKLFPGMTANVKILVKQKAGVLKVPNAALRYRPPTDTAVMKSTEKAVWVLDAENKAVRTLIKTGETDGTSTEVTGGVLKAGDRVVIGLVAKAATAATASSGGRGPGF